MRTARDDEHCAFRHKPACARRTYPAQGARPPDPRGYDRIVAFEISIATLNHIADQHLVLLNTRGRWTAFVKLAEWTAQVFPFLKGYWNDG